MPEFDNTPPAGAPLASVPLQDCCPAGGRQLRVVLRHGSIAAMAVTTIALEREDRLAARMAALGVSESDLEESFVRSGGHGGQNVNKTSTCVQLVHRPTGIAVKCQVSRQQGMNRSLARELLLDKIEASRRARVAAERAAVEKGRRQKRPRSRAAKARMLADKSHHAGKKRMRQNVGDE